MIGMPVRYIGKIYVIEGTNEYGDYDLVRFDAARRVWQRTSVQPDPKDPTLRESRHWEIVGPWMQKRLRRAILNADRLHPWLKVRSKSARHWRRARDYRMVLKRFFRRCQQPRRIP